MNRRQFDGLIAERATEQKRAEIVGTAMALNTALNDPTSPAAWNATLLRMLTTACDELAALEAPL